MSTDSGTGESLATVSATGVDAEEAVATVSELVLAGFGKLEAS